MIYPRLVLHAPKAKVSGEPLRRIVGRSGFLYACGEDGKGGGYVLRLHAGPRSIKADRRYGFDAPLSDIALGPDRWVWVVGSGMCEEFSFSEDGFDVWQMDFLYNPHAGGRRVDILNGIVIAGSLLYVSGNEVVMRSRAGPVRAWEALPIPGAGILGPLWGDEDGGAYVSDKAGQIYQIAPTENAWRIVGDPIGAPIRDF